MSLDLHHLDDPTAPGPSPDRLAAVRAAGLRRRRTTQLAVGGPLLVLAAVAVAVPVALRSGASTTVLHAAPAAGALAGPSVSGATNLPAMHGPSLAPVSPLPPVSQVAPAPPALSTGPTSKGVPSSGPAPCANGTVTVSLGQQQGAAGSTFFPLEFRVTGGACTLTGYPGVSFLSASHTPVGSPVGRDGAPATTVLLTPGQPASASVAVANPGDYGPPSACAPARAWAMRVYPPGMTAAVTVAFPTAVSVCTATSGPAATANRVQPVHPGLS